MKTSNFITNLVDVKRKLVAFASIFAIFSLIFASVFTVNTASVSAETINLPTIVAFENVSGEGIGDKVQGTFDRGAGKMQKNFGDAADRPGDTAKGALKEAKGAAKQNLGEAKAQADMAGDKAENAAESFVDSVKDFFE